MNQIVAIIINLILILVLVVGVLLRLQRKGLIMA